MPTVLYIIGSLELGGAESQLTKLIIQSKQNGFKPSLFVLESGGYFEKQIIQENIPIFNGGFLTGNSKPKRILFLLRAWFRLLKVIFSIRPDIVHAYLPLTNFLSASSAKILGVQKIITSRRALGTHQDRYQFWKWIDRLTNKLSHHVTVNSMAVWQDTCKRDNINPKKLVLIKNGLDFQLFSQPSLTRDKIRRELNLNKDSLGIAMVGNLIPYKGHKVLLEALASMLTLHSPIQVYLIGEDRGIQKELQERAIKYGIAEKVFFLSKRGDVPALLLAMDIYVHASLEEGSSNALLEAMAAGLPIIATNVGGNSEALAHGAHGILVPANNPNILARALQDLIGDKKKQKTLGEQAKAYAHKNYSTEQMAQAHFKLYGSAKK